MRKQLKTLIGGDKLVPYTSGSWGEDAKKRSKQRLEYFKDYRRTRKTLEEKRLYSRKYYLQNRDVLLIRQKEWRERNKHLIKLKNRERSEARKKPMKATNLVHAFHIPLQPTCEKCSTNESLIHHHPDYSKPLMVQTLCRSCHRQLHVKLALKGGEM